MLIAAPAMSQQPTEHRPANGGGTIHIEGPAGFEFNKAGPNVTFRRTGGGLPRPTQPICSPIPMRDPRKLLLGFIARPVPPAVAGRI